MTSPRLLAVAAASLLLASPVWAEDPPPPKETQFFEKFDTNLDGKVTREEFAAGAGDAAAFTLLDKDKDGSICPAELGLPADYKPRPRPEGKPAPGGEGKQPGGAPGAKGDELRRRLKEMDTDGDGRVSRAEWKGEAQGFDNFDRNKDGYLDKEDSPRGMGMGGGQPGQGGMKLDPEMVKARWKKMDRDGDGKVSKEEYTGDFEFDRLDSDKDGFLTDTDAAKLAEAMGPGGMGGKGPGGAPGGKPPAPPSPEEVAKRFTEMDRDQNGKVEAAEMPEMLRERMLRADTDGDGALTKDEFAEGMKKAQRGPGGKGGPGSGKGPGAPGGPGGKAGDGPQAPGLEILKRFDHDHDGKVERDQFPGSDEKFAQLDTDKDGVLTEKDFPAAPAKPAPDGGGAGTGLIAKCDKDGDGRLSRAEFQGSNDEWRALDTNQDGWVDAVEAGAVKPPAAK